MTKIYLHLILRIFLIFGSLRIEKCECSARNSENSKYHNAVNFGHKEMDLYCFTKHAEKAFPNKI